MGNDTNQNNGDQAADAKKSLLASLRIHLFTLPLLFFSFLFASAAVSSNVGTHTPEAIGFLLISCVFLYVFISWGTFIGALLSYFLGKLALLQRLVAISNHKIFYLVLSIPLLYGILGAVLETWFNVLI